MFDERVVDSATCEGAEALGKATGGQFYLAGGTGCALQLGHRVSLDLDLFSERNRLVAKFRRVLFQRLKAKGSLKILENMDGTCHLTVGRTAVSLFHYPYRLLKKPVGKWRGLLVAGLEDIAAMKLSAVIGRGSKKDFVDLFFICQEIGLKKVMTSGQRRYRDHPNFLTQASRSLLYFDDAEKEPMPRMRVSVEWEVLRKFFLREVPKYVRSMI